MSCCEKCWEDARYIALADSSKSLTEHYHDLIMERANTPCTPKEQAGRFWIDGRDTRKEGSTYNE